MRIIRQDVERTRVVTPRNIKDKNGNLFQKHTLIRERWGRWFHAPLNKSPTLDPQVDNQVNAWPTFLPLDDAPSVGEDQQAV